MGMASRGDFLHFFNYRIHTWKLSEPCRENMYTQYQHCQVSFFQEISLLTPTGVLPSRLTLPCLCFLSLMRSFSIVLLKPLALRLWRLWLSLLNCIFWWNNRYYSASSSLKVIIDFFLNSSSFPTQRHHWLSGLLKIRWHTVLISQTAVFFKDMAGT